MKPPRPTQFKGVPSIIPVSRPVSWVSVGPGFEGLAFDGVFHRNSHAHTFSMLRVQAGTIQE